MEIFSNSVEVVAAKGEWKGQLLRGEKLKGHRASKLTKLPCTSGRQRRSFQREPCAFRSRIELSGLSFEPVPDIAGICTVPRRCFAYACGANESVALSSDTESVPSILCNSFRPHRHPPLFHAFLSKFSLLFFRYRKLQGQSSCFTYRRTNSWLEGEVVNGEKGQWRAINTILHDTLNSV